MDSPRATLKKPTGKISKRKLAELEALARSLRKYETSLAGELWGDERWAYDQALRAKGHVRKYPLGQSIGQWHEFFMNVYQLSSQGKRIAPSSIALEVGVNANRALEVMRYLKPELIILDLYGTLIKADVRDGQLRNRVKEIL